MYQPHDASGRLLPHCIQEYNYCHSWLVVHKLGSTFDRRTRRRVCENCKAVSIRRGPSSVYATYTTKEYDELQLLMQLKRELKGE